MKTEVHALIGAYALDALEAAERRDFEAHLARCEDCTAEVRGLRETTVRLGRAAAVVPPERLKRQVMARLATTRQLPPRRDVLRQGGLLTGRVPEPGGHRRSGRSRGTPWLPGLVVAASLAVAVLALGLGLRADGRAERAENRVGAVAAVLTAQDARTVTAQGGTLVMSRERDKAVFTGRLAGAPRGHVYELWLLEDGVPRPAGLVEDDTTVVSGLGGATGLAVTVEPEGGSDRPTTAPVTGFDLS